MTREDGLRWKQQWQAAGEFERQESLDRTVPQAVSIARALSVVDLACEIAGGWPPREELTFSEQDLAANDRWVELRRRLGAP
ncbi:MAG: hypothetical protein HY303_12290 [Candidatus Wallbacteria bacterium]|nr:hypothetical protein [Candidatus Wallbacteria bacterium]